MGTQPSMTSPATRRPATPVWTIDDGPVLDRYTLLLAATGVWVLLLLLGLVLTFG